MTRKLPQRKIKKEKTFADRARKFQSIKMWASNFINFESRHQNIMEDFEDRYVDFRSDEKNKIDPSAEPINILCIDGGGMKG